MSRGLQAEKRAPKRAKPVPARPESIAEAASPSVEDQRLNTGGYRVSLPMFEGPLDLLLHLVQKHELDILNIPIAFITERYVEYIQLLDELNIDLASEYLVMAATLVHIKSRMLLPNAPEDESGDGIEEDELDPRAELVRRLLEYQKYKLAAEQLGERAILGRDVFPRGSSDELAGGEAPLEGIASFKLLDAFQAVLERTQKTREHQIDFERFSLSDKIAELSELLQQRRRLVFHEIFRERATRAELIITFLALLEMTRLRLTRLRQDGPLEPIYIELTVADEELPPEELPPEDALIPGDGAEDGAPAGQAAAEMSDVGEASLNAGEAFADAALADAALVDEDAADERASSGIFTGASSTDEGTEILADELVPDVAVPDESAAGEALVDQALVDQALVDQALVDLVVAAEGVVAELVAEQSTPEDAVADQGSTADWHEESALASPLDVETTSAGPWDAPLEPAPATVDAATEFGAPVEAWTAIDASADATADIEPDGVEAALAPVDELTEPELASQTPVEFGLAENDEEAVLSATPAEQIAQADVAPEAVEQPTVLAAADDDAPGGAAPESAGTEAARDDSQPNSSAPDDDPAPEELAPAEGESEPRLAADPREYE